MNILLKVYQGLVGIAVTIALTITFLLAKTTTTPIRGMATSFVGSVGIIGALWITCSPEPSSKIFRLIGLLMAAMCAVGVYWGGWSLGWLFGLVGWLGGLAIYAVLTRLTRCS